LLTYLLFCEHNFWLNNKAEFCASIKQACKLAVSVPDHKLSFYLFELWGYLCIYF